MYSVVIIGVSSIKGDIRCIRKCSTVLSDLFKVLHQFTATWSFTTSTGYRLQQRCHASCNSLTERLLVMPQTKRHLTRYNLTTPVSQVGKDASLVSSSASQKLKLKAAVLRAKAEALRKMHEIEVNEQRLKHQREALEIETALAVTNAELETKSDVSNGSSSEVQINVRSSRSDPEAAPRPEPQLRGVEVAGRSSLNPEVLEWNPHTSGQAVENREAVEINEVQSGGGKENIEMDRQQQLFEALQLRSMAIH